MRVISLKDGDFLVNKHKEFALLTATEPAIGIRMAVQPFLVLIDDEAILLDAGVGWQTNGKSTLLMNLAAVDVQSGAITRVLLTHLHKDHVDGLILTGPAGFHLAFPQARVYLQRREYAHALTKKGSPSYDFDKLEFLIKHAAITWLDADEGFITPKITFQVVGGHTPFHQVFWVTSEGETAFYGGDNLPQAAYLAVPMAYKADDDGKKAMGWRKQWQRQAKANNCHLLLYHDRQHPIIRL